MFKCARHYLVVFHITYTYHEQFCLLRNNLQGYFQFTVFKSSTVVYTNFRPTYPTEELEEEEITEDDAELTLNKLEEDVAVGLPNWF